MGRNEVRRALEALAADETLLHAVADGDVDRLRIDELTEPERQMMIAAAADWPDVAGFDLAHTGPGSSDDIRVSDISSAFDKARVYGGFTV